jgi:phosphate transport system substrate-binding protein
VTRPATQPTRRRSTLGIWALLLVIVVLLYGVLANTGGWWPFQPSSPDPQLNPESLPDSSAQVVRLQGSNTIGADLAPDLAEGFLASKGATDVRRTAASGFVTVSGTVPGAGETRFEIRAEGTETAFDGLGSGSADVGMASRRIRDVERQQLHAEHGDLTSPEAEHILALDAVAVIVSPNNRLRELSMDQLRRAFTCEVTDWAQLVPGLPAGPIRLLARDANSGTYESFQEKVLGSAPLCPNAERFAENERIAAAVAQDPAAIGFVALPSVGGTTALALYDDASRAMAPTSLSVSTESYLLTRRLYLYVPPVPANPLAKEFVDGFTLSDPGQRIVADAGFVSPLFPPAAPPSPPCVDAPPDYCAAVTGAERVPFDVRFDTGTDRLDNRATRNLDLLAASTPPGAGRQVLLVGFADSSGAAAANLELSRSRASAVSRYLAERGLTSVTSVGFGDVLPVATNDTPEGREQNRRVEVWLR